ncbi:MAG: hypothetical protein ACLFUB_01190 [Cyclobacteriaceae bacterium]
MLFTDADSLGKAWGQSQNEDNESAKIADHSQVVLVYLTKNLTKNLRTTLAKKMIGNIKNIQKPALL